MRPPNYQVLLYNVYAYKRGTSPKVNPILYYPNIMRFLQDAHGIGIEEVKDGRKIKLTITITV